MRNHPISPKISPVFVLLPSPKKRAIRSHFSPDYRHLLSFCKMAWYRIRSWRLGDRETVSFCRSEPTSHCPSMPPPESSAALRTVRFRSGSGSRSWDSLPGPMTVEWTRPSSPIWRATHPLRPSSTESWKRKHGRSVPVHWLVIFGSREREKQKQWERQWTEQSEYLKKLVTQERQ